MNRCQSGFLKFSPSLVLCFLLLAASCSNDSNGSNGDSGAPTESVFAEVKRQTDPVAELTAQIAVAMLSPQSSGVEATTTEIQTKHRAQVEQLKVSLCKTLQESSSKNLDQLRAIAQEALRDSFVVKFIQRAAAATEERQVAIVQTLAIKSSGADGTPQTGAAALKDASFTDSAGALQPPERGTTEYIKFVDWMGKNDALLGFTDTVTKEYTEAIEDCPLN